MLKKLLTSGLSTHNSILNKVLTQKCYTSSRPTLIIRNLSVSQKWNDRVTHPRHPVNIPTNKKIEKPKVVDSGLKEVYIGILAQQFKLLKAFSIGTSVIALSVQPLIYQQIEPSNISLALALGSFIAFFNMVTPLLVHSVAKKYITKLDYDSQKDEYIATVKTFFLQDKKIPFTVDEVIKPEIPKLFTTFFVRNKALYVDPETFEDMHHYSRIMGYDKPIDFSKK